MIKYIQDNQIQPGLLALTPFLLVILTFRQGLTVGLIFIALLSVLGLIIFGLRKIIPYQHKLIITLFISATIFTIARMLLNTQAYTLVNSLGLIFPLIVINALYLSVCETVFSEGKFKSIYVVVTATSLIIAAFFSIYGLIRSLVTDFAVFASPAGCLLLAGFILAAANMLNNKYISKVNAGNHLP